MGNITLETKKIAEIDGKFFVPAYQRGYRWGKEATRLLDDILEIDEKSNYRYCLQPIVVKKKEDERFELIDGQQRLTTVYLIYKVIKKYVPFAEPKFSLSFEVRTRSEKYLNDISITSSEENIDYYFIKRAFIAITKWFENQEDPSLTAFNFYKKLTERVDVIWYEVDNEEDGNALFQRLNIGKIPLTSSELVKALFLSESGKQSLKSRQEEIALQWDAIEKELHDNSLWYFLTNKLKRDYQTRIDLILNLISRFGDDTNDKYATFFFFDNLRKKEDLTVIWNKIQHTFLILKDWYNNHALYHRIGYLITIGVKLEYIYDVSIDKTKSEFNNVLIKRIKDSVSNIDYGELSYNSDADKKKITRLLLLFNVESTRINGEKSLWFPFDKYKSAKWSLEHIHAQQSEGMKTISVWKDWLRLHLESLKTVGKIQVEAGKITLVMLDELINEVNHMLSNNYSKVNFGDKFNAIREKIEKVLSDGMGVEYLHSISNLALLNMQDNAALSNSTFDVKRNQIIEMMKKGKFIPHCTQMVFLKYYTSSAENQVHFWGQADRDSYVKAIYDVLKEYITPIEIFKEDI